MARLEVTELVVSSKRGFTGKKHTIDTKNKMRIAREGKEFENSKLYPEKYREEIVKYAEENSVWKAAIKYDLARKTIYVYMREFGHTFDSKNAFGGEKQN